MSDDPGFFDFLRRLRAGESAAAALLVRDYEPLIRIEVRRRVNDPYLNRLFDSADICQSVLASFFVRAAAGQFELHNAEDLTKLLLSMARKKVASQARKQRTQARDSRRVEEDPEALEAVENGPSPASIVAWQELFERFQALLSDEERQLVELRRAGRTWPEIAGLVGGQAQARRKQLDRALARVSRQLGLDEEDDHA
jgi:RNA polymerase sigma-70 factor (ECF subfamily)